MSDRISEDFGVTVDSTAFLTSLTVRELVQRITGVETRSSDGSSAPSTPPSMDMDGMVGMPTITDITPLSDSSTLPTPGVSSNEKRLGYDMTSPSPLDLTMATAIVRKPTVTIPPATSILLQGNPATATKVLWLVPDGSGLATSYLPLPDVDAKSVAVYGLNSPFIKHTDGMSEYTFTDLTTAYLTEIRRRQQRGPYFLGGWSAGGICAYDIAQRLTAAGEDIQRLILLDSPNPIGLEKLPARLYDDFDRLGIFGAVVGRKLPPWLLPHCLGFIDILHTHEPRPFVGPTPLTTWVVWAEEGVADNGSIEIRPSDPPNMRWLLLKRTNLGPNGWDQLVGSENMTIEVLGGANHFTMLKETSAKNVSAFIARAMA